MYVKALRKTRSSDIPVELSQGTTTKAQFGEAIRSTLGDTATIRCVKPRAAVELRELEELTTEEEVLTAVYAALEKKVVEEKVSKDNLRGQNMATVTFLEGGALRLCWP